MSLRLVLLALASAGLVSAAKPQTVRSLRQTLYKVAATPGFPAKLVKEAKHVIDDADKALEEPADKSSGALATVEAEYKSFLAHLMNRGEELKQREVQLNATAPKDAAGAPAVVGADMTSDERDAKAAALATSLNTKIARLLVHISQEKGLNNTELASRDTVETTLNDALKKYNSTASPVEKAVALHEAMVSARDYILNQQKRLDVEQSALRNQIEEGEDKMLLEMLRERKHLPMKSQLAVLKRHRHKFKDSVAAQQLLKKHDMHKSLYDQLVAILPKKIVDAATAKPMKTGHLAASGSDGRVLVVSSRLKNTVQTMVKSLTAARDKLVKMASQKPAGPEKAAEIAQARQVAAGLDAMLKKVGDTHDLKTQLEAMDEVQSKLEGWGANATKLSTK